MIFISGCFPWEMSQRQTVPRLHRFGDSTSGVRALSNPIREVSEILTRELYNLDEGIIVFIVAG